MNTGDLRVIDDCILEIQDTLRALSLGNYPPKRLRELAIAAMHDAETARKACNGLLGYSDPT
jgi:hypothetical protein